MSIAVRYHSRSGNTKKVAEAIAGAAGVEAENCGVPLAGPADILFLGGALYAGGLDAHIKTFVQSLGSDQVSTAVIFSTTAVKESAYPEIKNLLAEKGIVVSDREFHCRGRLTVMHMGRPNQQDLEDAARFAAEIIQQS